MKELDELRDKMAMDACMYPDKNGEPIADQHTYEDFIKGWSALLKLLERSGGEFDANNATRVGQELSRLTPHEYSFEHYFFTQGAKWQFEADRARIGLANSMHDHCKIALNHQIKKLEARLAESECANAALVELRNAGVDSARLERDHFRDKLSAAEAEIERLRKCLK